MVAVDAIGGAAGRDEPAQRAARAVDPDVVGRRSAANALFVAPYFLVFVLLVVVPLFLGLWLSFQDYDMLGGYGGYVGLKNFQDLGKDRIFIQTIFNTIWFVVYTVPAFVLIGLFLALALNNAWRSSVVLRSIFFGSQVLSVTIVTLIWRLVYMPDRGLLFNMTASAGLPAPNFIADPVLALVGIAIVTVWWTIGLPMMLFLAALQQIPDEVYEAAALDNASRWRTLTKITLPAIRRTMILVAVIEIVLQFQLFGQANLITNGGPNNLSRPMVMFIYEAGFRDWALGYAAAASQVLFFVMLVAAAAQMWLARQKEA